LFNNSLSFLISIIFQAYVRFVLLQVGLAVNVNLSPKYHSSLVVLIVAIGLWIFNVNFLSTDLFSFVVSFSLTVKSHSQA